MNVTAENRSVFRQALIDSLPVMMGYLTMGLVAGVLLAAKGGVVLSPLWAFLSGSLWVTGTMSFAGVPHIAARGTLLAFALLTLSVNFRYALYGFSMLSRWRNVPFWHKCYLVLMLTDENYALEAARPVGDERQYVRYCTFLSMLNHSYWVGGLTLGAVLVCALGMLVRPETIRRWTNGMDFAMTALFLVIFTDQVRGFVSRARSRA